MNIAKYKKLIKGHQYYKNKDIDELIDKKYQLASFFFDVLIEEKKEKKLKDNNCSEP